MDFNQMPLEAGYAFAANRMAMDHFSNLSDDEKKKNISKEIEVIYLKKKWTD